MENTAWLFAIIAWMGVLHLTAPVICFNEPYLQVLCCVSDCEKQNSVDRYCRFSQWRWFQSLTLFVSGMRHFI